MEKHLLQTAATAPLALIGIEIGRDVFHFVDLDMKGKTALKRKIKQLALTILKNREDEISKRRSDTAVPKH
jgi:hypothetical protein